MDQKPTTKTITLQSGSKYSFCTCGHSKNLPFCDESHKQVNEENGSCFKSFKIWPKKEVDVEVYCGNWEKN